MNTEIINQIDGVIVELTDLKIALEKLNVADNEKKAVAMLDYKNLLPRFAERLPAELANLKSNLNKYNHRVKQWKI